MWKNRKSKAKRKTQKHKPKKRDIAARLQARLNNLTTLCQNNDAPAVQHCLAKWPTYLASRADAWLHAYEQACQNNHIDLCHDLCSDLTQWGVQHLSAAVKISARYGHKDLVDNFLARSSLKKKDLADALVAASQFGQDVLVQWLLDQIIIPPSDTTYLDALSVCKQKSTVRLIVHKWVSPEPWQYLRQFYYGQIFRVIPLHLISAVLIEQQVRPASWFYCCSGILQRRDLHVDVLSEVFCVLEPQGADMLANEVLCLLIGRFGIQNYILAQECLGNLARTKTLAPVMAYCIGHIKATGHPHSLPLKFANQDTRSAATFLLDCGAPVAWFPSDVQPCLVIVHKRRCRATEKLLCVWLSTNISRHVLASYVCFSE
jgi:hypothetical protein